MEKDDDFGLISFSDSYGYFDWKGKTKIPFIDKSEEIELMISSNQDKEISDYQRSIYKKLIVNYEDFYGQVKQALFNYYHQIRKEAYETNSWHPDDFEEMYPNIKIIKDLESLYYQPIIHLFQQHDKIEIFGMGFSCDWDLNYGTGIRIESWKVANIGIYPDGMWK